MEEESIQEEEYEPTKVNTKKMGPILAVVKKLKEIKERDGHIADLKFIRAEVFNDFELNKLFRRKFLREALLTLEKYRKSILKSILQVLEV